jgi:3-oxosteroid 1-dehydrogenase
MERDAAEVDVVVAGRGAAGMTAALTAAHLGLSALVIERAGSFGGSTARSGGGIWAPGNSVLRAAGVRVAVRAARARLLGQRSSPSRAEGAIRLDAATARPLASRPRHARF